ncbi:hypothetical protein L1785_19795 [Antribacter sp. KLBMP9083]|uniref:Uncharacterized protein n=1 Tax=Antribacter soli TaxID=2910976 RepID=A0AA41QHF4_9MICO|nr:hypothetical protein [Antribacter soli]MCF4123217.1 hypothetical protein [Antribacter soli]
MSVSVRGEFDRKTTGLVGVRIDLVDYWDIHNFSDEPREWDYGDWHHAAMGVELKTSAGPVSVIWTDTFYPYGVEVFSEPITKFLAMSDDGPERWTVTDHPEWRSRMGQQVLAVDTHWERLELGPARYSNGRIAEAARTLELPAALRFDFAAGPVWFVAGIPTEAGGVFIPGDEIMVVFTSEAMLRLGFPAGSFTGTPTP